MKISGKTILLSLGFLLLIGGVFGYYFLAQNSKQTLGWTESNWLYRKSVFIKNKGSMIINKDYLLKVDTKSLISSGKLKPNCEDLRFTNSNDSASLSYQIKSGCNTASTQILIRIPVLPEGGKTIDMYYGNDLAKDSQEELTINN